jgi:hypothetical protein
LERVDKVGQLINAIGIRARKANAPMLPDTLTAIKKCRETLESATLSEDQYSRYENVKNILKSE